MGVDITGRKAQNKHGEYFRNNWWHWRPLWEFCRQVAPEIVTPELYDACHSNDGEGLPDQVSCDKLIIALLQHMDQVPTFKTSFHTSDGPYPFTEENIRDFIGFLACCGGFEVH